MNTKELQAIIRMAMSNAKGDDLERANNAFQSLTSEQLKQQHGQSGETKEEIWNGYKEHRANWEEANAYLARLFDLPTT